MKYRLSIISLLVCIFLASSGFNHPIKMTTSLIEYDAEKKRMNIECRVFIDDFQNSLGGLNFDASKITNDDIEEIENYFDTFFKIVVGEEELKLNYRSSKVYGSSTILALKFSVENVFIDNGDDFLIENKLFFLDFGPLQTNSMTLRIPPFISQEYREATFQDYHIKYQF